MLHFDGAYYVYQLVETGDFYVAHDRYVNYLSQWLPLLGLYAGAGLPTLLLLWSLSFALGHYLLFLLVVYGFRNPAGGVLLAVSLSWFIRYKYYVGVSETVYALAWLGTLAAWLTRDRSRYPDPPWRRALVAAFLILACLFCTPVTVVAVLALLAFDGVLHRRYREGWNYALVGFTLVAYGGQLLRLRRSGDWYEQRRLRLVGEQVDALRSWADVRELYVWDILHHYLTVHYTLPLIVCLAALAHLGWRGHRAAAATLLAGVVAVVGMVVVVYANLTRDIYNMLDGYLGTVGCLLGVAYLYGLLRTPHRRLALLTTAVLMVFTLHRTAVVGRFFGERSRLVSELTERNRSPAGNKLQLPAEDVAWAQLWFRWSLPYETLVRSSLAGPGRAVSIGTPGYGRLDEALARDPARVPFDSLRVDELNLRYWRLDSLPYRAVTELPRGWRRE